jgi:riboflavin-specific deaminase-like protein
VELDRLHPDPGRVTVDAALRDLRLAERAPADRPYLVLNMVASIDGRTTLGGKVGALTSPIDQAVLYRLRSHADALLVGAGTVRNERYGNLLPESLRAQRAAAGLHPEPLVVIVSASGVLPPDLPLLGEPGARVLIATANELQVDVEHAARVEYVLLPDPAGGVDCGALCTSLRTDHGVRSIVCEGGPSLNEALIGASVVDELFLSLAPKLVGGGEKTLVDAAPAHAPMGARLLSVATADDYLFLRYALGDPA